MARTGGEKTRRKILEAAEELFSKNGFHATTIKEITREARVNQGLVYYYFKDKNDIVVSLFNRILEELSDAEPRKSAAPHRDVGTSDPREALKGEISFLNGKRKIISVMLMEALKSGEQDTSLFQCAGLVMRDHGREASTTDVLVHEFFTGFIPLVAFVALQEKFCDYFHCDKKEALDRFVDSFVATHVNTHPHEEVHSEKGGS